MKTKKEIQKKIESLIKIRDNEYENGLWIEIDNQIRLLKWVIDENN